MNKELAGASTVMLVLGLLAREPMHGYQLVKQANEQSEGAFTWQEGTIYPILHKLEHEGLVRAQWQAGEAGRRRKVYEVTQRGRESLHERAREWGQVHTMLQNILEAQHA